VPRLSYKARMSLPQLPRPAGSKILEFARITALMGSCLSLGSCFYLVKVPYRMPEEYQCSGTCVICTEVDSTGACISTESQTANVSSGGEVIGKLACGFSSAEASADCMGRLANNVASAFPDQAVQSCTAAILITEALCDEAEDTTSYEPSGSAQAAMLAPDPSLGLTTLKLTSASSSLAANWRGTSATKALSGYLQYRERPFAVTFARLWAPDTTIGGESFGTPNLRNHGALDGTKDSSGNYTLDLATPSLFTTYTRSGEKVGGRLGLAGAVTGNINLANGTFTGGLTLGAGADNFTATLVGTVFNRAPVASFTTGGVTNCTVAANGTGSSDPDGGSIQTWRWSVNGRAAGVGSTKTLTVHQGPNVIRLAVTDNEQSVSMPPGFTTITVNANPACP